MAKNDAIKKMHIQQGDLVLADKNIGAEAQYVDVSYDKKNDIIEDINAEGVKVDKTEALSTTLKNLKGMTDKAVIWDEMNVLGSKNMMRIGPQPSGPIAGVTYTIDQKTGVIVINGSPNVEAGSKHTIDLPNAINEACYFTIDCNNLSTAGTSTTITLLDNNGNVIKWFGPDGTTDGEAEIEVPKNSNIKTLQIEVSYGSSALNLTIKPMLRLQGIKDRTYEPYAKTNQELTRDLVDFKGATDSVPGTHGLVPAPTSADIDRVLKGDGTWGDVAAELAKLKDVSVGNANIGDQLTYAGGNWIGKADSNMLNHNGKWTHKHDMTHIDELPYSFYHGSAVVFNNEIHILGSNISDYYRSHYAWNGTSWRTVSTLPYIFYNGSAVVFNNEIHILGGYDNGRSHYAWNGTSWRTVSTLPYNFYNGSAVVFNNEIHILGSTGNTRSHYAWNGTSWRQVSTLPYFYSGSAVVFNNEIHILGSTALAYYTSHAAWDGTSWRAVSTLPYNFYNGSAVVFNNEIHILGGYDNGRGHYAWNGTSWRTVSTLPYNFYNGSAVVFNNEIHILGSDVYTTNHYAWNTSTWHQFVVYDSYNLPYNFRNGDAIVYNNKIHLIGGNSDDVNTKHYAGDGTTWMAVVPELPFKCGYNAAVVYHNKIHTLGAGFNGYSANHWTYDGTSWNQSTAVPYSFGNGAAVVYNDEIHIFGSEYAQTNTHRAWNDKTWRTVSTIPYTFCQGCAVVYNEEIHLLGGRDSMTNHYAWNGTSWRQVSTIPFNFKYGSAIAYNGEIHIFGSSDGSNYTKHYAWNGSAWKQISTLPYNFYSGGVVLFNDQIWIIGTAATTTYTGNSAKFVVDGLVTSLHPGLCPATSGSNPKFIPALNSAGAESMFLKGNNAWTDIGINSIKKGVLVGDTSGFTITLGTRFGLLFTQEYTTSNTNFRGMHAYYLGANNPGGTTSQTRVYSLPMYASSSSGITLAMPTGGTNLNIKCSSTAYTSRYLLINLTTVPNS